MRPIHPIIASLLARNLWPTGELNRLPSAAVRSVAPDEERLCLSAPSNFRTIAEEMRGQSAAYWTEFGALSEIDPARALIIGDFGLGSDAPIIIDPNLCIPDPKVMRLSWHGVSRSTETHWVTFFEHLSELASFLERNLLTRT